MCPVLNSVALCPCSCDSIRPRKCRHGMERGKQQGPPPIGLCTYIRLSQEMILVVSQVAWPMSFPPLALGTDFPASFTFLPFLQPIKAGQPTANSTNQCWDYVVAIWIFTHYIFMPMFIQGFQGRFHGLLFFLPPFFVLTTAS